MDFAKNWNKDSVENKIKDKIFEFVYGCALHDAILQLAFKGEKKWIYQVNGAKFLRMVFQVKKRMMMLF